MPAGTEKIQVHHHCIKYGIIRNSTDTVFHKFAYQEIRWNFGIWHSPCAVYQVYRCWNSTLKIMLWCLHYITLRHYGEFFVNSEHIMYMNPAFTCSKSAIEKNQNILWNLLQVINNDTRMASTTSLFCLYCCLYTNSTNVNLTNNICIAGLKAYLGLCQTSTMKLLKE